MKRFALILTLCGLLLSVVGCKQAKEGPFTFTNKTSEKVYAIISQDKTVEKEFDAGASFIGEDYFVPKITFVKNLTSEENKKITDNRFVATTANGFDYIFSMAPSSPITISLNVPEDFTATYTDYQDWYIKEVDGKLAADSNTTITFSEFEEAAQAPGEENPIASQDETPLGSSYNGTIYTDKPEFRVYRSKAVEGKTEAEDITGFFSVVLSKSEILSEGTSTEGTAENTADTTSQTKPTVQWSLKITYPKMEPEAN